MYSHTAPGRQLAQRDADALLRLARGRVALLVGVVLVHLRGRDVRLDARRGPRAGEFLVSTRAEGPARASS